MAGLPKTSEAVTQAEGRRTQATILVQYVAQDSAGLFQTPSRDAFLVVREREHLENLPLRSRDCKLWLARCYFRHEGRTPSAEAIASALSILEGQALFDAPVNPVSLRVAEWNGAIYLDLANDAWEAVEIRAAGWRLTTDLPQDVRFRRTRGMLPLPRPLAGGSVDDLRPFVNLPDDSMWRMFVGWLVASLRPGLPFPILTIQGEHGSCKSSTARAARGIIDPSSSPLRSLPREARDFAIAARNSWVVCYDNLSGLPRWISDDLCRLATGGGLTTRELYSDADEIVFDAMRPVIVNGIEDIATHHDLADRALYLTLPSLDGARRPEAELRASYEGVRPRVLGALCTAISCALDRLPQITRVVGRLPRMADFGLWCAAAEPALGWPDGSFLRAYEDNRHDAVDMALDADAVAVAIRSLTRTHGTWRGTATMLLSALEPFAADGTRREKSWPRAPNALSARLRRAKTSLREVGVEIEMGTVVRDTGPSRSRVITLRATGQAIVQTVRPATGMAVDPDDVLRQSSGLETGQTTLLQSAPQFHDRDPFDAADGEGDAADW